MSTDRSDPTLAYTLPFQLTKKIHRRVPDALQPERPENSQKGKVIVITGGGTGIGAAAARVWVRAGAAGVVVAGRRKDKLDETVKSTEDLNDGTTKVLAIATDLTVESSVANMFQEVAKEFGRPADVVLANAGALSDAKRLTEDAVSAWWNVFEINILGLHNTVVGYIKSQPDQRNLTGTIISVNSGLAGKIVEGNSAYSISKLASHRYMEFVATEYPAIRSFTLLPGVVGTPMSTGSGFDMYARDEAEQTGALALFLATSRADYLKGSLTSINWDLEEMEERKADIENGLLKMSWVPILPTSGGAGF